MGDKYQPDVQGYPLAPATVVPRSDEEYGRHGSDELMKKKKRMKCFAYIAIFVVFQVAVILIFSLTVMRVKTPKVRLDNIVASSSGGGADIKLSARVLVKNTNFGHYKFDSTLATIRTADGSRGGQFAIQEARAKARSTKKIAFVADVSGSGSSGSLDLIVETKLRGKVTLMKVMKKKKSADMYCTFTLVLSSNTVQNLSCK